MPNPILSSLILPVKDQTTGEVTNVEYDLPASGSSITVDDEISSTSTNPVQNKVISDALDEKANTEDLGTAATRDVPTSGNANVTQVVIGSDTRLTNARPASDVSDWAKADTKPTYTATEVGAIPTTEKGANSGVAELDENGKVPSSQLPSYVDDVIECDTVDDLPLTGETGKIYVVLDTNKTYRWSGSAYVVISPSLALGETSSTAYRGDRGKTAYDHSQTTSGNPHNVTKSDVGLGNVGNYKAVSTVASQGLTDTEKSNARANIGAGTSSLALGTTSSTAYRGDYGNSAYTHAVTNKGAAFASGLYKITTNSEGHVTAATAVAKADITGLGIPGSDTNTHRPIQVNGTEVLGNNTTALNLKAGSNVSVTNSSGTVTIAATDTTYGVVSSSANGLAPKVTDTSKFLKGDGTWATPTNTTYGVVSTSANGLAPKVTDTSKYLKGDGTWATPTNTDTKNTAGSTDTSSKIFLIGATSQAANPQTYSHDTAYVDTDGCLYSGGSKVLTAHDGNNRRGFYGTCATAAGTAEKKVTLSSTAGWELVAGTIVGVKFTNTNTAGTAKLNVNSSGAKNIWYNGAKYTGTEARITGWAGHVIYYMYDGTYWCFFNNDQNYINTNTTYSAGSNITLSGTTFSLTKANVTGALGYTPPTSNTDTKNTAGSTDTSSKIFLIGATSQAANPQTYSHDTAYVGTDGCLYSGGTKVLTAHQDISGKAPTNHASTGTGYGAGTASNYGHVKLSDTYKSNVGAAANSIGASQTALYNAYNAHKIKSKQIKRTNNITTSGANQYFTITDNLASSLGVSSFTFVSLVLDGWDAATAVAIPTYDGSNTVSVLVSGTCSNCSVSVRVYYM